jgi:signal-transduction protein with cAMP-binding, CBS, and nucleotidyltransferase domain
MALERRTTLKIRVREVMNSPLITGSPEEPINEIARRMAENRVGSVVIMQEDEVLGIVTDGDIVNKVVAKNLKPSKVRAEEVMSSPLHTIEANKDITDAARMMRRLGIKRLGVVYKGHLVGVISMSDVLNVTPELVDLISEKARIISGESIRRRRYISGYCDSCGQWSDYLLEVDGKYLCEDCRGEVTLLEA